MQLGLQPTYLLSVMNHQVYLGRGIWVLDGSAHWHEIGNPYMAVCQNLVPLVNPKIAGKWMFIPLKIVLIGIDPYPHLDKNCPTFHGARHVFQLTTAHASFGYHEGNIYRKRRGFWQDPSKNIPSA